MPVGEELFAELAGVGALVLTLALALVRRRQRATNHPVPAVPLPAD
jgi:hypothetical protein